MQILNSSKMKLRKAEETGYVKRFVSEMMRTFFVTAWEQRKFDEVISRIGTGLNPRDNFTLNTGGENYYVTESFSIMSGMD